MKPEAEICCPKCGKSILTVPIHILSYSDPKFSHKCGYKGWLNWVRPVTKAADSKRKPKSKK